ncbi:MAG: hypothetical protein WC346_05490 [Methanogenium sp.]|jgi:hypothetical protein
MNSITQEIDQLAEQCCKKMDRFERADYFRYQEDLRSDGKSVKKRYETGKRYYKGKRKGQLRDVYEVDGIIFNRLWNKIHPYAVVSVVNSRLAKDRDDVNCIVSEIKTQAFYVLRSFGPVVQGNNSKKFSEVCRTIVINVLQTTARRRGRIFGQGNSTRTLFDAASIHAPINNEEELTLEDQLHDSNYSSISTLSVDIPVKYRPYITELLKGRSLSEVARRKGYRTKEGVTKFRKELRQVMGPILVEYYPEKTERILEIIKKS